MRRRRRHWIHEPRPSVPEPRRHLLPAVLNFVHEARVLEGVHRIALLGSLATEKPVPKDADVLVTIDADLDLRPLGRVGRRLKGAGQQINLSADIFLADTVGRYLGRICRHRVCHLRATCLARHCGRRQHLRDDLDEITLDAALIAEPPIDLWPDLVRRCSVPADVEALVLKPLEEAGSPRFGN